MKYGHFDDTRREYVIERPDTPMPWINYLGCEEFFGLISNTGGGYCFYRDARLRRTEAARDPHLVVIAEHPARPAARRCSCKRKPRSDRGRSRP